MNLTWQDKRMMSATEFNSIVHELGLSRNATARYLGVSNRTAARYAKGEIPVPTASALLLRALVAYDIEPIIPKWQRGDN